MRYYKARGFCSLMDLGSNLESVPWTSHLTSLNSKCFICKMGNNHSYLQGKIITIHLLIDSTFVIAYLILDLILGPRGHNIEQAMCLIS